MVDLSTRVRPIQNVERSDSSSSPTLFLSSSSSSSNSSSYSVSSPSLEANRGSFEKKRSRIPVDQFISLGSNCHARQALEKLGWSGRAGPFDAIFSSPELIRRCLGTRNFQWYLDEDYISKSNLKSTASSHIGMEPLVTAWHGLSDSGPNRCVIGVSPAFVTKPSSHMPTVMYISCSVGGSRG